MVCLDDSREVSSQLFVSSQKQADEHNCGNKPDAPPQRCCDTYPFWGYDPLCFFVSPTCGSNMLPTVHTAQDLFVERQY